MTASARARENTETFHPGPVTSCHEHLYLSIMENKAESSSIDISTASSSDSPAEAEEMHSGETIEHIDHIQSYNV